VRKTIALVVAATVVLGVGAVAVAGSGGGLKERLTGFEEVPAISTPGNGEFRARINEADQEIRYELTFGGMATDVRQAHIHFENRTNNGAIVTWLCDSATNPSPRPSTPECPAAGGTVTGVILPDDVGTASAAQGIGPGEFDEFVRAIRAGATYANVHTVERPGGEIRAQLENSSHGDDNMGD